MGNLIEKMGCFGTNSDEIDEKNVLDYASATLRDTESTASFGQFINPNDVARNPKMVKRFCSFRHVSHET